MLVKQYIICFLLFQKRMQILGYGSSGEERIAIDKPLFDLNTFSGRFRYFAWVTNPALCLVSDAELDRAKELRAQYL